MDDETKQSLADYAEERANAILDKAVDFAERHGPQAVLGELTEAGALLSAAAALRQREE